MEIGGHIRVHPHMTYHLGAAKLVVTGGQNVIFWHFRALKDTIPLRKKVEGLKNGRNFKISEK